MAILEKSRSLLNKPATHVTCMSKTTLTRCRVVAYDFSLVITPSYLSIYQSEGVMKYYLAVVKRQGSLYDDVRFKDWIEIVAPRSGLRLICVACMSYNSDKNVPVSLQCHFG